MPLPFTLVLPLTDKKVNRTRSDLIVRWIEFWCQMNTQGEWSVVEYDSHVEISFEKDVDYVLFKLSPEFNFK